MVTYAVRRRSRTIALHWVVPVFGFAISGFVLGNADPLARIGGLIRLAVGSLVLLYYVGEGTGVLAEHAADPFLEAGTASSPRPRQGPCDD